MLIDQSVAECHHTKLLGFYFPYFQDFFRNLPHWVQQHMDMNDAGNFLIETCDETVSRDLKQQLLLLNGRWRELFVKVKHVNISFKQRILHLTCI